MYNQTIDNLMADMAACDILIDYCLELNLPLPHQNLIINGLLLHHTRANTGNRGFYYSYSGTVGYCLSEVNHKSRGSLINWPIGRFERSGSAHKSTASVSGIMYSAVHRLLPQSRI